jgi:hypothetical protein
LAKHGNVIVDCLAGKQKLSSHAKHHENGWIGGQTAPEYAAILVSICVLPQVLTTAMPVDGARHLNQTSCSMARDGDMKQSNSVWPSAAVVAVVLSNCTRKGRGALTTTVGEPQSSFGGGGCGAGGRPTLLAWSDPAKRVRPPETECVFHEDSDV